VSLERGQRIAIAAGVAITAGVAAWALTYMYAGRAFDARKLIESLPPDRATHVYIDVDALRKSGVLDMIAGAKATEEPDYRKFVEQTGFDYRTDLDAAAIAFIHGNTYMALRGRFKSDRLSSYARAEGGVCRGKICSMQGSQPNRKISFYPMRSSVLALAVTPEETGATLIGPAQWKKTAIVPGDPVWISVPAFELADVKDFPAGDARFPKTALARAGSGFFDRSVQERHTRDPSRRVVRDYRDRGTDCAASYGRDRSALTK
jgi:hypothetical protein